MSSLDPLAAPIDLPAPITDLCADLESHGIPAYSHGDPILSALRERRDRRPKETAEGPKDAFAETQSLFCVGTPDEILRALPRAVVTAAEGARLTHATAWGPVDLVCGGRQPVEDSLMRFGLGPFGIAFRPADDTWVDPMDQRTAITHGRLELLESESNPFWTAPRRYWIAARLLAENGLAASADCLEAARDALPSVGDRLPQAAPARRELARALRAPDPEPGLAFLRECGVSALLFPGTKAANERRIARLPELPAVRWAAWLRGSATGRGLVRLRMPHELARRVERVQAHHPIERVVEKAREHGVRKLMQRLDAEEIDALMAWRRLELEEASDPAQIQAVEKQLTSIDQRIREARATQARTTEIRALAMDGAAVMQTLGAGPGRHVGQALTHLAHFTKDHPERNDEAILKEELVDWAKKNTNLLDRIGPD